MTTALALAGGPSPLWYASRAAGTTSLVLLTGTVALGIGSGRRAEPRRIGRFEIGALHRNLSLLTLVFLVLHVVTAVLDPFVHLGWAVSVVPFVASYRPLWLGLGTVALDLLLAVLITSALRQRLGVRLWKTVHWLAYAAWPFALFHGVATGTDTRLPFQLWLYAACLATVVAAVWWRLAKSGPGRVAGRLVAAVTAAAVPVVLGVFLATGPLRPGWAHRAAATALALGGVR
ncbi:ferric reductase-like transmembrane domain-containing protein [Streptomyces beihaiensis]|uniref:Ferric reductase-like transmembrane domain-containing protein n=1 Tax=Streptomyces beihaiensis TaxID=2984495 RepID=A0ABT3U309_9ACTN|nr:ferric reductase-like transmembrane domain-containing protein [Streptomyces beihaiensis]MCX3063699.1 ferric reductase-like transmembrane domain-containing protein [Streptomyces beihaiensis]